jgi:hypothetical protein
VTQGHMDRGVRRSPIPLPACLCVDCFFLSSRIGCVLWEDGGGLHLLFVVCFFSKSKKSQETKEFLWLERK